MAWRISSIKLLDNLTTPRFCSAFLVFVVFIKEGIFYNSLLALSNISLVVAAKV